MDKLVELLYPESEEIKISFYYLVVRKAALYSHSPDLLHQLLKDHGGYHTKEVFFTNTMGPYLYDTLDFIESKGLIKQRDYVYGCMDPLEFGVGKYRVVYGVEYNLGVNWLRAVYTEQGLKVKYHRTFPPFNPDIIMREVANSLTKQGHCIQWNGRSKGFQVKYNMSV